MLQWFIKFPEFFEFNQSSDPFRKNSNVPEPFLDPISDQGHILSEKSYLWDGHAYLQVLQRSRLFFLPYVTLSMR